MGGTVCHPKQDQAPAGFRTLHRASVLVLQTRLTRQGGDKVGVMLLDKVALGIGQGAYYYQGSLLSCHVLCLTSGIWIKFQTGIER